LGRTSFPGFATSIAANRLVDQLADAGLLGVGLKVRPAHLLRHPEHVLGQILLVGVLAGYGSMAVRLMFIIQTTYGM